MASGEAAASRASVQNSEHESPGNSEEQQPVEHFSSIESIYEYLGGAGRYNIAVLILMMLGKAFPGMITLSPNFTAAGMRFNCSSFSSSSTTATTPTSLATDNCTLDSSPPQQCWLVYNCSTSMSDEDKQIRLPCTQFSFRSDVFRETSVSRFELVCDRAWMAHLATTFYFIGFLVGCSFYGALADGFGRLKIIWISALNLSLCITAASFAPILWLYWSLQLLAGFGNGGLLTCLYTYALENTDTKHRAMWGFMVHNGWTLGLLIFTLMAYFERDYQKLLLYSGISMVLLLILVPFLSESPRWLISTGRYEQADKVFHRISRINRRPLRPDFSSRAIATSEQSIKTNKDAARARVWQLFSRLGILRITLTNWSIFFGVSMAYFGLSLSVDSLGSDIFVNQIILAAVEPFSRLVCLLLSFRFGRRPSIGLSFGLAALSLAATGLLVLWPHLETWRMVAAITGKFWITMAFDLSWLYAAELFPTALRSIGVGSSSTLARVGALLSTLAQNLASVWAPLPFLVFAAGPLVAVLLTVLCCLPETRGRRLPESVEEDDLFARGRMRAHSVSSDRQQLDYSDDELSNAG
ncbi:hypothetical protein BOX15_Mlig010374g1 [Macrostomum lignano]|uniref:Major facilitator superfamily (MFS) profile domain-containing protein n=1 Tax=Macrostomum lignano TaxID=282301 RepID=A0A267FQ26_9PLAT|nr:hypothetical protein BOX15_Mlig010374g1 [Macrostomum lignano]